MTVINILSFALAVVCYGISQLQQQGKLKWQDKSFGFWGAQSWYRKYKRIVKVNEPYDFEAAPKTWYYRFFKISYKEKFPGSATIFVSATDSYHLFQLIFKFFLILTLVTYEPVFNMVGDFIIYFALWGIVFSLVYKFASK